MYFEPLLALSFNSVLKQAEVQNTDAFQTSVSLFIWWKQSIKKQSIHFILDLEGL